MNTTYINWKNYSFLITALLIVVLLLNQCESETTYSTVTTPEVSGTLPTNHSEKIVHDTVYIPKGTKGNTIIPTNSDSLQVYKDELDFAVDRFAYEKDSLQKLLLFKNAISLKSFTTNFEDDFLKLELNGIVSGELKEVTPTYTIKSQKVDVKVPEVKFRLLAGGGFGVNKEFNQTLYKANIGWQKQSGNVYRVSYLNVNGQPYGVFEVDLSLFKIVK